VLLLIPLYNWDSVSVIENPTGFRPPSFSAVVGSCGHDTTAQRPVSPPLHPEFMIYIRGRVSVQYFLLMGLAFMLSRWSPLGVIFSATISLALYRREIISATDNVDIDSGILQWSVWWTLRASSIGHNYRYYAAFSCRLLKGNSQLHLFLKKRRELVIVSCVK